MVEHKEEDDEGMDPDELAQKEENEHAASSPFAAAVTELDMFGARMEL